MNRSWTYTVAAIIQLVVSIWGIVLSLPPLMQGVNSIDQAPAAPPALVIGMTVLGFSTALLGLMSAYGVWRNQKWGVILTIVLRVVNGLAAMPGILLAPTAEFKILASAEVLIAIVVIALLLWPKSRLATA